MNKIVCEFCGMTYPEDSFNKGHPLGYTYMKVIVLNTHNKITAFKTHIICKDCYDKMEEI